MFLAPARRLILAASVVPALAAPCQAAAARYSLTDLGPWQGEDPKFGANNWFTLDGSGGNPQRSGPFAYSNTKYTPTGELVPQASYAVDGGPLTPVVPYQSHLGTVIYDMNSHGFAVAINILGGADTAHPGGYVFEIAPNGTMTPIPTLADDIGAAYAINDAGAIVGSSQSPYSGPHAFLFDGKATIDLNTLIPPSPGLTLESATGIDDYGRIVGVAYNAATGQTRDYLLTPTPEPTPSMFAALACGGLAARALARRGRGS